jgi:hypothetical protein
MLDVAWTWGTTAEERAMSFACDRHLPDPDDVLHRGVDVAAPLPVVFRWLCQLRVAPYSYDWIDNWGWQSPRTLIPGLEELAVGQRVMTIFDLVEFERDRHLTVRLRDARSLFGDVAGTYLVAPRTDGPSRLMVKLLVRYPRTPLLGWLMARLLPWGDLVMMRKQLLTLKALAERRR